MLTATPHNGYSQGFYSLLRLLDEFLASEEGKIDRQRIDSVLVRRKKSEVYNKDGTRRFRSRHVGTIPLKLSTVEQEVYQAVCNYCERQWKKVKDIPGREAVGFAMTILKKRLLSSPEALRISLRNRKENLSESE